MSSPSSPLLIALAAVLALSRPLLYDAGRTPLLRRGLRAEELGEIGRPLNLEFAGELTLLAWDTSADFIGADDSVTVELYWKATRRLGIPYGFDVRLVDDRGLTWSEREARRPRDWRFTPGTDFWPVDQYILDPYTLTPLAGTPPDAYTLQVTVFMRHNLQSIGTQPVGRIAVTAPSRERACVPGEAAARPLGALELQSVGLSTPHASPGDDVVVSLCWRAEDSLPGERAAELRLLNDQGSVVAAQPFGIGGAYPTARWVAGEVVRDQVSIRLPAMLVTGEYGWVLSSANESVALGSLQVTAPPRTFVAPPAALILNASLGPVTLFGIGDGLPLEPVAPGSPLAVKLIWQAAQTPPGAYHVFLHLLDAAGTLVAQSDGVPADWSRPTTSWLHGEFVADARTLALPPDVAPGTYTLFAGMYTPAGGERLTTPAFPDGRVRLGEVRIGK